MSYSEPSGLCPECLGRGEDEDEKGEQEDE